MIKKSLEELDTQMDMRIRQITNFTQFIKPNLQFLDNNMNISKYQSSQIPASIF
jgi:hypothetical protein